MSVVDKQPRLPILLGVELLQGYQQRVVVIVGEQMPSRTNPEDVFQFYSIPIVQTMDVELMGEKIVEEGETIGRVLPKGRG